MKSFPRQVFALRCTVTDGVITIARFAGGICKSIKPDVLRKTRLEEYERAARTISFCLHRGKTIYGFACRAPFDSEPGSNYDDTCRFYRDRRRADLRDRYFTRIKYPDNEQLRDIFVADVFVVIDVNTISMYLSFLQKLLHDVHQLPLIKLACILKVM